MAQRHSFIIVILVLLPFSRAALPSGCKATPGVCPDNSRCDDGDPGSCVCNGGYKLNGNSDGCIAKGLGDGCTADDNCNDVTNSKCGEGDPKVCICIDSHKPHGSDGTCTPKGLGDECTIDDNCNDIANTKCGEGDPKVCICIDSHKPHGSDGTCIPRVIGGSCSANTDCDIDNSQCTENTCECTVEYKYQNSDDTCIAKDVNDFVCSETVNECEDIANAECYTEDGKCRCNLGFTVNGKTCVENAATFVGIGELAMALCCFLAMILKVF